MVAMTKKQLRNPPFPVFGKDVSSFEVVRRYLCSYSSDDISLSKLKHLERELFFIHHISPTKQK
jgi:Centromere protein B dimerisation domain.